MMHVDAERMPDNTNGGATQLLLMKSSGLEFWDQWRAPTPQ
jgi:hypothetical protein